MVAPLSYKTQVMSYDDFLSTGEICHRHGFALPDLLRRLDTLDITPRLSLNGCRYFSATDVARLLDTDAKPTTKEPVHA